MEPTDQRSMSTNPGLSGRLLALGLIGIVAILGFWLITREPEKEVTAAPTGGANITVNEAPGETVRETVVVTSAVQPTTGSKPTSAAGMLSVTVEGGSFYFKPNEIKVKKGQSVKITLSSVGGMPHDFIIDELNVRSQPVTDSTTTVEFTPDKVGTFEYYCSVGKHRELGMKGQLIVE